MELPTRSLVLRVCQFRHDRINEHNYISTYAFCQLIFILVSKKVEKNSFFIFPYTYSVFYRAKYM